MDSGWLVGMLSENETKVRAWRPLGAKSAQIYDRQAIVYVHVPNLFPCNESRQRPRAKDDKLLQRQKKKKNYLTVFKVFHPRLYSKTSTSHMIALSEKQSKLSSDLNFTVFALAHIQIWWLKMRHCWFSRGLSHKCEWD